MFGIYAREPSGRVVSDSLWGLACRFACVFIIVKTNDLLAQRFIRESLSSEVSANFLWSVRAVCVLRRALASATFLMFLLYTLLDCITFLLSLDLCNTLAVTEFVPAPGLL